MYVFACFSLCAWVCVFIYTLSGIHRVLFPLTNPPGRQITLPLFFCHTHAVNARTQPQTHTRTPWRLLTHWASLLFCSRYTCSIYHLPHTWTGKHSQHLQTAQGTQNLIPTWAAVGEKIRKRGWIKVRRNKSKKTLSSAGFLCSFLFRFHSCVIFSSPFLYPHSHLVLFFFWYHTASFPYSKSVYQCIHLW